MAWEITVGYGQRALVETIIDRYKSIIAPRLRVRRFEVQQAADAISMLC